MILFLDFDGVLHYDDVLVRENAPVIYREGCTLFQWVDPLIEALVPHPHIKIILSTSWVGVFGYDKALAALPEALRQRVIGATYTDQGWYSKTRYQQIAEHVQKHQITHWLAVDDDVMGWPANQRRALVECSSWFGLSQPETRVELRDALAMMACCM